MKTKSADNQYVRKSDLDGAVDAILTGVDNMFKEERKYNKETFATKNDLDGAVDRIERRIDKIDDRLDRHGKTLDEHEKKIEKINTHIGIVPS